MIMSKEEEIMKAIGNNESIKEMAEEFTSKLKIEITKKRKISWSQLLEVVNHDELVYKLTLKYLRRDGYDIGNNKNPEIKNNA